MKKIIMVLFFLGLIINTVALTTPIEIGEKIYLFEKNNILWSKNSVMNLVYSPSIVLVSYCAGASSILIHLPAEACWYELDFTDTSNEQDIYTYLDDGTQQTIVTNITNIGGGFWHHTANFYAGRRIMYLEANWILSGEQIRTDLSYLQILSCNFSKTQNLDFLGQNYTESFFVTPQYFITTTRNYSRSTYISIDSYPYSVEKHSVNVPVWNLSINYRECLSSGVQWIDCHTVTKDYSNNIFNLSESRDCGFWTNFVGTGIFNINVLPEITDNPILISSDSRINLTVFPPTVEIASITWHVFKSDGTNLWSVGIADEFTYEFDAEDLEFYNIVSGSTIFVQADITDVCGYERSISWKFYYSCENIDIDGKAYRVWCNNTQYEITNGSVKWGEFNSPIINGSFAFTATAGINDLYFYDYDTNGTEQPIEIIENVEFVQDMHGLKYYIAVGDECMVNLNVCYTDNNTVMNLNATRVQFCNEYGCNFILYQNVLKSNCINYSFASGETVYVSVMNIPSDVACVYGSIYGSCIIPFTIYQNTTAYVILTNKTQTISLSFFVQSTIQQKVILISGAKVDCGSISGVTGQYGELHFSNVLMGQNYNCSVMHPEYNPAYPKILNLSKNNNIVPVTLYPKKNMYYLMIVTYHYIGEGDIERLANVKITISGENYTKVVTTNNNGVIRFLIPEGLYTLSGELRGYYLYSDVSDLSISITSNIDDAEIYFTSQPIQNEYDIYLEKKGWMGSMLWLIDQFFGTDSLNASTVENYITILTVSVPMMFLISLFVLFCVILALGYGRVKEGLF